MGRARRVTARGMPKPLGAGMFAPARSPSPEPTCLRFASAMRHGRYGMADQCSRVSARAANPQPTDHPTSCAAGDRICPERSNTISTPPYENASPTHESASPSDK